MKLINNLFFLLTLMPGCIFADCSSIAGNWNGTWKTQFDRVNHQSFLASAYIKSSHSNTNGYHILVDLKVKNSVDIYLYGTCINSNYGYTIELEGQPGINLEGYIAGNIILADGEINGESSIHNIELMLTR